MSVLKQDINLYQPNLYLKPALNGERLIAIWMVLLGFLIAQGFWQHSHAVNIDKVMAQEQTALNSLNEKIQMLTLNSKGKRAGNNLQEALSQLKSNVQNAQAALVELQVMEKKDNLLSVYLEGLVNAHVKGTYISQIQMNKNEQMLVFDGMALEPKLVPQMVQSWQQTKPFSQAQFKKLSLERMRPEQPWVKFNVQVE